MANRACLSVELNMHPNRQFPGLFVVHMPSCLHVLLRVTPPNTPTHTPLGDCRQMMPPLPRGGGLNTTANTYRPMHCTFHGQSLACCCLPKASTYTLTCTGGVCAQHAHKAHVTGKKWGVCYNWQYSCRYTPYYTPAMLDSLMFHPNPTPSHGHGCCS